MLSERRVNDIAGIELEDGVDQHFANLGTTGQRQASSVIVSVQDLGRIGTCS